MKDFKDRLDEELDAMKVDYSESLQNRVLSTLGDQPPTPTSFWEKEVQIPLHFVAAIVVIVVFAGTFWFASGGSSPGTSHGETVKLPTGVFSTTQLSGTGGVQRVH